MTIKLSIISENDHILVSYKGEVYNTNERGIIGYKDLTDEYGYWNDDETTVFFESGSDIIFDNIDLPQLDTISEYPVPPNSELPSEEGEHIWT